MTVTFLRHTTASEKRKLHCTEFSHQIFMLGMLNTPHRQQNPDQEVKRLAGTHSKVVSRMPDLWGEASLPSAYYFPGQSLGLQHRKVH